MSTWTSTVFTTIRTTLGATKTKHKSRTYNGTATSIRSALDQGGMVLVDGAEGAVRYLVSELKNPHPKTGDTISVQNTHNTKWGEYTILNATYEHQGETLLINYGAKYGG